jgi:hypothetical protein
MASGHVNRIQKAEHMAAPTNAANVKKALANSEPSTHGGTLLPSAKAASCPQLAEGDLRAPAKRSGFDPERSCRFKRRCP